MSAVAWGLVGVGIVVVLGLLVALLLGAGGMPGDAGRRLGQRLTMRRHVYRGTVLPDEVPEAVDDQADAAPGDEPGPR
jgi:hypothetical protein